MESTTNKETKPIHAASEAVQNENNNIVSKFVYEFTQFQGVRKGRLCVYLRCISKAPSK